jgi:hypothetical protein
MLTNKGEVIAELRTAARAAAEASRAPSSERAYAADWRDFCAFAARIGRARLPTQPDTFAVKSTGPGRYAVEIKVE